jgi:hypothetical protein
VHEGEPPRPAVAQQEEERRQGEPGGDEVAVATELEAPGHPARGGQQQPAGLAARGPAAQTP